MKRGGPCPAASTSPRPSRRSGIRPAFAAAFCGRGMNSSFETTWVGTGESTPFCPVALPLGNPHDSCSLLASRNLQQKRGPRRAIYLDPMPGVSEIITKVLQPAPFLPIITERRNSVTCFRVTAQGSRCPSTRKVAGRMWACLKPNQEAESLKAAHRSIFVAFLSRFPGFSSSRRRLLPWS